MEKNDKSVVPPRYVILKRSNDASLVNPDAVTQENQIVESDSDRLDGNIEEQTPPVQLIQAKFERIRQKIDLFLNMNEAIVDKLLVLRHILFELGLNAVLEANENEEEDEDEDEEDDEEDDDGNNDPVERPAPAA